MESNSALIGRLRQQLCDGLRDAVPTPEAFALLDFPNHSNVGDSAIYLGTLALLESIYGQEPAFVASMDPSGLRRRLPPGPGSVIFLNGGGNFGDVWPDHQNWRDRLIGQFPDYRIVQLPQSLHFGDSGALARTAEVVNGHPSFVLMTRDQPSLEIARRNFRCATYLVPDAAFMLSVQKPQVPISQPILLLLRTDKEALPRKESGLSGAPPEDWLTETLDRSLRQRAEAMIFRCLPQTKGFFASRRPADFRGWAQQRLERGLRQLSKAEVVVTDRLHVHILCLLLGKPHVVLDNAYGKLSAFVRAWTETADFGRATNLHEAVLQAETHLTCRTGGWGG